MLLKQLKQYEAKWPDERLVIDKFRNFVLKHPNCFDRSLLEGHVTGSGLVFHPSSGGVLLTHHAKLGKWLQLGGHSDGHPLVHETALRECEEESGLSGLRLATDPPEIFDLDIHEIPERKGEPRHFHYDVRYLILSETMDFTVSKESLDLKWFTLPAAYATCSELSMHRQFDKLAHR